MNPFQTDMNILSTFEPLCFENFRIDHDYTLFQELVNEGKQLRILNYRRTPFSFNDKTLRDAAAVEVNQLITLANEGESTEDDGSNKKRRLLNADEKVKVR